MFARLYQNKCSKFLIIFLSKVYCKKGHGLYKNIKRWTQKSSKVKKKITHILAKIFHKREIYFREHSRIRLATKYSIHMHILIYEYDTSLLDPGFDFTICKVTMLHTLSLSKLHISFLEVEWIETKQCLGKELYTLSDLRESFEVQSYVLI